MKKSYFRIFLLFIFVGSIMQFYGGNLLSQPACKFTFCSCCADSGDSYNIYTLGNTYVATINITADGCSLDSAINLTVGSSYYVITNDPYCDNIQYVYFTACVCGNESFMRILLPCCGDGGIGDKRTVSNLPSEFKLNQNYPNPFNPVTKINFELPEASFVKLTIYDITGKLVDVVLNNNISAGYHEVLWNAGNLDISSGIYFYKLEAGSFSDEKKMVLIK